MRPCITSTSTYQKLQARNAPSPGGNPSVVGIRLLVAQHQSAFEQALLDGAHRPDDPRIVGGQKADDRRQQHARVHDIRSVILHERADLRIEASRADVGVHLVAQLAPSLDAETIAKTRRVP